MTRSLFSLLAIIAALAIVNGQPIFPIPTAAVCPKNSCAKPLEECGPQNFTLNVQTFVGCKGESRCSSSNRGVCVAPIHLGEPYEGSDAGCESGSEPRNGFCAMSTPKTDFKYPGERCSHDIQCVYSSFTSGDDTVNVCNGGRCKKVDNGEYCNSQSAQCDFSKSYCGRSGRCEKNIKKGGLCNRNDATVNGCGRRSRCMPTTTSADSVGAGTCQPRWSLGEGKPCTGMDDCDEGLFCAPAVSGQRFGVCTKPIKTSTVDKECTYVLSTTTGTYSACNTSNSETCRCTKDSDKEICTLTVNPSGYGGARWNFEECVRESCGISSFGSSTMMDNNRCIYNHCRGKACSYYEKLRKTGAASFNCQFESFCDSAFILSVSPFLVLSALVAMFLF